MQRSSRWIEGEPDPTVEVRRPVLGRFSLPIITLTHLRREAHAAVDTSRHERSHSPGFATLLEINLHGYAHTHEGWDDGE